MLAIDLRTKLRCNSLCAFGDVLSPIPQEPMLTFKVNTYYAGYEGSSIYENNIVNTQETASMFLSFIIIITKYFCLSFSYMLMFMPMRQKNSRFCFVCKKQWILLPLWHITYLNYVVNISIIQACELWVVVLKIPPPYPLSPYHKLCGILLLLQNNDL